MTRGRLRTCKFGVMSGILSWVCDSREEVNPAVLDRPLLRTCTLCGVVEWSEGFWVAVVTRGSYYASRPACWVAGHDSCC